MLRKRSCTGMLYGKFRSVGLAGAPKEACSPPAPKGTSFSEFEKKKRSETRSRELWKSRSQSAVNWLSVKLPGLLTVNGTSEPTEVPAGTLFGNGQRYPFPGAPNWLLLNARSDAATGSTGTPRSFDRFASEVGSVPRSAAGT